MSIFEEPAPGSMHQAQMERAVQITIEQIAAAKQLHDDVFGEFGDSTTMAAIINAIALNYSSVASRVTT
jgi:hypothetical protein